MIGDVLELELRGKATDLQKTIDDTNKQAKQLKQTITEIEKSGGKGSEEWKKYKNELKATQEQAAKLSKEIKTMDVSKMTIRQLELAAKDLAKEMKNADRSSQDYVKNAKRLGEVEKELDKAAKQAKELKNSGEDLGKPTLWNKITSGVKGVNTVFQAMMALQVVQWIFNLGKQIFDITAKFEKYEKVLSTALGDPKVAKQSLEAIKKMAAETAFSVDELTEGYVKMVNRGLRPSQKEMTALADLAASQGKTFDQLVESLLDASTAEFERLKEFGMRASKAGEEVAFKFKDANLVIKNTGDGFDVLDKKTGKVVNTFVNQEDATLGVLTAMGQMGGVAGQNAEMMETLTGKSSNLGDSFDALMVGLGNGLKPVFVAILNVINEAIPLLSFLGKVLGTVLLAAKGWYMGLYETLKNGAVALMKFGEAAIEFTKGNVDGAKKLYNEANESAKKATTALVDNVKQAAKEIGNVWTDPSAGVKAEFAGKDQGAKYQGGLTDAQKKEAEKREKEKQKELEKQQKLEQKHLEDVQKDRDKALELIAQLESEHQATVTAHTLASEEAKINEVRRKRLKQINDSLADETTKEAARIAINKAADADIEKSKAEFAAKELKAQQEAAQKRIENAKFITEQERQAELILLDWKELNAKGNATKLATIAKERLDTELRFLKEKLSQEEAAEKARIAANFTDKDQAAAAVLAVEKRYHAESEIAEKETAEKKKKIDQDLHDKKQENLKGYSNMFQSLLKGDVDGFTTAASKMVSTHKAAWQEKLAADQGSYEAAGAAAQAAVNFLNDLAQKKAAKAIAEANRERDEKVAILQNELSVTESLVTASSNFVTALKAAETDRLAELQRILTDETSTEEQKRDALKKYYSEQLQQMKAAEEQKIQDLQRMANLAKTEDEKQAIEAKIALAKKESEEKIRLAEEEMEAKTAAIEELTDFTTDTTNAVLKEANKASQKQIKISEDEAVTKMEFKEELEETIAAENRKARATEMAEKKKAFAAQKKADIATALITGALAVLKALANFFPLNIILAATAAVVTGVQIAKIKNQPEPTFAQGGTLGHVPEGGKHGSIYGTGGIGLFDRATGRDVGEMEGGEAIISTRQTEANWPIIQRMFKNARTPGMADTPVIPHPAMPMAFADGGRFESPYFERGMYLFGSKKKKAAAAAAAAEEEAAAAQAEADAAMADMPSADTSGFDGIDGTEPNPSSAESDAAFAASQAQGKEQLQAIKDILDATVENGKLLSQMNSTVGELKGSVNGVEGAVNSVRDAVYNTTTQGKFDQLIGAISNMSAA